MKKIFIIALGLFLVGTASAESLRLTCDNGLEAAIPSVLAVPIPVWDGSTAAFTIVLKNLNSRAAVTVAEVSSGRPCELTSKNLITVECQNGYKANLKLIRMESLKTLPHLQVMIGQFANGAIRDLSKVIPQQIGCAFVGN